MASSDNYAGQANQPVPCDRAAKDKRADRSRERPTSRIIPLANKMRHERERECQIHRIVSLLMERLSIRDGHELVSYFGDGPEKDNREAIATWIKHLSPELPLDGVEERLADLRTRVDRRLAAARLERHYPER